MTLGDSAWVGEPLEVQNVRRGHSGLAVEAPTNRRLLVAFNQLAMAI